PVGGPPGSSGSPTSAGSRAARSMYMRQQAALYEQGLGFPQHQNNGDEASLPGYIGNYSKGLPHNALGEVDPLAYLAMLRAVGSGSPADFEAIPLGGTRALTNPQGGLAFALQGPDPACIAQAPAPALRSAEQAAEIAENYWMALLRDLPFQDYLSDPLAAAACIDLSAMSDFRAPKVAGAVTPQTLFRSQAVGTTFGPYISQFMWLKTPFGAEVVDRKMRTRKTGVDYMTGYADWLAIQNGVNPSGDQGFESQTRYIINGRDLSEWVHIDVLFQAYFNALLILFDQGAPMDAANPYRSSRNQAAFGTFGPPYIASILCGVARTALAAVWYQKWFVHRRLRPEAMAGRIHNQKTGAAAYGIHPDIMNSQAIGQVYSRHGSYLLPMAFPEGSPTHPAYGAGHATVAGACVTILKAMFDETWVLPAPVLPTADGQSLVAYGGAPLTVGGELNKLAANVAFGRNIAGVHWRTDGDASMRLGEDLAIRYLREDRLCMNEPFTGFSLTRFDGTTITI
ncbi:MAG: vanadium-dependent haloperoxidase, partial [Anaerolineae bacterium]